MTINEHIDSIKNMVNSGLESDDSRFSDRFIYHQMKLVRSKLVKQKADKHHFISDFNYQTICLRLELAAAHDCDCVPDSLNCKVRKSELEIPEIMSMHKVGYLTKNLCYVDGTPIPLLDVAGAKYNKHRKYTKEDVYGYIHNNKMYIVGDLDVVVVQLTAVFAEPETLEAFNTCDTDGCFTSDPCFDPTTDNFPVDSDLSLDLENLVVERLLLTSKIPEDIQNDANDNIQPDA